MTSTDRLNLKAAVPLALRRASARSRWLGRATTLCAALLLAGPLVACQGEPVGVADAVDVEPSPAPAEYPVAAAVDLGSDSASRHLLDGFSLPERVGSRFASWSEGEVSTLSVDLRGGAAQYLIAFLAEPYHMLGEVSVGVALNRHALGDTRLARGWRAYRLAVGGDRVVAGRNQLSFHYSKTGRPSDFDPRSTDVRPLSVRFDQVQIAPIGERVQLRFGSKNALALSALGEGWAHDPNDRGTGTWTVAKRAELTFHLVIPRPVDDRSYQLTLTARAPRGVVERGVALSLNGAPLGSLSFSATKATATLEVPAERLKAANELSFEFEGLKSPAELDAESKDKRLLGLRLFELVVAPREPGSLAAAPAGPAVKEPVAEAAAPK